MIITVVCDVLGKENNGTTIAIMNLVHYLTEANHTVRVITCDKSKTGKEQYYILPVKNFGPLNFVFKLNGVVPAKADTKIIESAIKDCDLVHTTLFFGVCRKAIKIARKYNKPITSSVHGQAENILSHVGLMNCRGLAKLVYKDLYNHVYKYSDAIHYPTKFMKDTFENAINKKTNGYVISNGVNAIFKKAPTCKPDKYKGKYIILSIGRVATEKNQQAIIRAVSLSKYVSNIKVIIAGAGPKEKYLRKLAEKLNVDLEINFYSREDLAKVINFSDLYIHTAIIDLESIACLEAISSGLVPIIMKSDRAATKCFALDDHSLCGYQNYLELSDKIDYWLDNPDIKQIYSDKYVEFMKEEDQLSSMKKMEKMMLETIDNYKKSYKGFKKVIFYQDELNDDFAGTNIKTRPLREGYKYIHKNIFWKFFEFIVYRIIAQPLVTFFVKIGYHQSFKNKKALKGLKNKGAYVYLNHTSGFYDAFIPNMLVYHKRNYILVGPDTMSIKGLNNVIEMLGAIPVSSSLHQAVEMNKCIEQRIKEKSLISIYPEAHIWPYYNDIRPFKDGSFFFPSKDFAPVYAVTNTFKRRKYSKKPKVVTYIDGPFYANPNLTRSENMEYLRNLVYNAMKEKSQKYSTYEYYHYEKIKTSKTILSSNNNKEINSTSISE